MDSGEKKSKKAEDWKNDFPRGYLVKLSPKIIYSFYFLILLLITNLNAIIDSILHPEIPYFDEEHLIVGGITGFACLVLFIFISYYSHTVRQYARKESRLRKRFEYLTLYANDIILLTNETGEIIEANNQACLTYGYSTAELENMNIGDLYPIEKKSDLFRLLKKIEENDGLVFKDEHLHKNGSLLQVEISSKALLIDNERYFQSIIRDITDRKLTEDSLNEIREIFNHFLENSPIYVFFKDENIRSMYLSNNYEQMLGKPLNELLGKSMDELFPSDLSTSMVADDLRILQKGEKIEVEEEFNGHYYFTIKFPINIEGKPKYLAGFTIDITERKMSDQALKESESRLLELNATKDKFFSIIAHDLKNPFNSILGFSNLLADQIHELNNDQIEEFVRYIQKSSQIAFDLLGNLLEWTRSQTGRMVFNPEFVEMVSLIREVTGIMEASAQQKNIAIVFELPKNAPVIADKDMISTVLRNLISNAVKFTYSNGEIVIAAKQLSDELVVSVSDNGLGIRKESLDKLFRIEESYTTPGTNNELGTGLGLILCQEFINQHGGKIWAESEFGKGSTFSFTIPK
jgi:two-component system, sensor histidine kinase and response regulator